MVTVSSDPSCASSRDCALYVSRLDGRLSRHVKPQYKLARHVHGPYENDRRLCLEHCVAVLCKRVVHLLPTRFQKQHLFAEAARLSCYIPEHLLGIVSARIWLLDLQRKHRSGTGILPPQRFCRVA